MDTLQTFDVNGALLKIISDESESETEPSNLRPDVIAPGTGAFEIAPLILSTQEIAPGESLSLSTRIYGDNIAFIYTELLIRDYELDQFYGPLLQEYVLSAKNAETQGLQRPVWDSNIDLNLNITPNLRVLTDGIDSAFAFMRPLNYAQDGYQLDGLYTREGTQKPRPARLKFNSAGDLTGMLVFKEKGGRLLPHDLTIYPGDQFAPYVQILTRLPEWQISRGVSNTLTWHESGFRWINQTPVAGEYLLGLVVQDMDGELTRQYVPFSLTGENEAYFKDEEDKAMPAQ